MKCACASLIRLSQYCMTVAQVVSHSLPPQIYNRFVKMRLSHVMYATDFCIKHQANSCMHENMQESWQLFVDGASRNNPGDSGAGVVLAKNNKVVFHDGFFLGKKTNNQAEYLACIIGLF